MKTGKVNCVFALIISVFFFCGCSRDAIRRDPSPPAEYRKISAEDANRMMTTSENIFLLDVRTEAEFREKRIAGAVLIPNNEITDRAAQELPDNDALILVYCQSGVRSAAASRELVNMGYTNVYDFGGIANWPYETTRD